MYTLLIIIFSFLLGASVGSFLSVVIYRIKTSKKGIIFGHSFCPHCNNKLSALDLIPVFGYILLGGKCRYCKKPIAPSYFFLEIITGLVFTALYLKFPFLLTLESGTTYPDLSLLFQFGLYAIYGTFFVGIFFYDLQTKEIPDIFLFPLLGISILGSLILHSDQITGILIAVFIALVFYGGQILISNEKWLGEGDLYLAFSLAIIFGWQLFIVCTVLSYVIGTIVSIPLLLTKKAGMKTALPFAPFMITSAFITIFYGNELLNAYLSTMAI